MGIQLFISLSGIKDWTWGLTLVRQVLYPLSHARVLLLLGVFFMLTVLRLASNHDPPTSAS
jgi:hypothetical protein